MQYVATSYVECCGMQPTLSSILFAHFQLCVVCEGMYTLGFSVCI